METELWGARFAEIDEIKRNTVEVHITDDETMAAGCPVISDGKTMFVDAGDTRTLIVSDSGAGKTRRLVLPALVSMAKSGESVIIHDCKGELFKYTGKLFKEHGYQVVALNFRKPMTGQQFNPLRYPALLYQAGDRSKATELFMDFSISLYEQVKDDKDPFWTQMSEQYFTGLCLLACELYPLEKIILTNIFELHIQSKDKVSGKVNLQVFFEDDEGKNKIQYAGIWQLLEGTVESAAETKASILSVFSQPLARLILNDDISDMLSTSSFDIDKICDEKVAIFLCTRDETRVYDNIVSGIVHQLYVAVIEAAEEKYHSVLPIRMNFILEELGCMAKIMDFNSKLIASRSRNIRMHLVVQSLQQLSLIYGEQESQIILGNTDVQFYYHSSDKSLLDFFSDKAGMITTKYTNEKRPLLSSSDLLHFDKESGQVLVFLKRNYPFITCLPDISQYEVEHLNEPLLLKRRDRTYVGSIDFRGCVKNMAERVFERLQRELNKEEEQYKEKVSMEEENEILEPLEDGGGEALEPSESEENEEKSNGDTGDMDFIMERFASIMNAIVRIEDEELGQRDGL